MDLNKNIVIEASAGTGKTYNIIEIVNDLVTNRNIPLSKILIVTYTEKACGELKDRIRGKLNTKESPNIYTIHSFCKNVISEFGLSSNLPLDLEIVDDSYRLSFINEYIRSGKFSIDLTKLSTAKFDMKQDNIIDLISKSLNLYYLNSNNLEEPNVIKLKEIDYFDMYFDSLKLDINEFKNKYTEWGKYLDIIEKEKNEMYQNICFNYKNHHFFIYDTSKFKNLKKFTDTLYSAIEYFKNIKNYFESKYFYRGLVNKYLKDIYIAYQEYKLINKKQDISDLIRNIREELCTKNNKILLNALKNKYTYGLIDEFQDTNQLEFDIFKKIFMDDENHHIIVVGDPKQSIYAFQGADYNAYLKAKEEILQCSGNLETLSVNYRSSYYLVEGCKRIFTSLFEGKDFDFSSSKSNAAPDGNFSVYYKGKLVEKPIKIACNNRNPITRKDYNTIICEQILDFCSTNPETNKPNFTIQYPDNVIEPIKFNDITILCRSNKDIDEISRELKIRGIPTSTYKERGLFSSFECEHFIRLLECLNSNDLTGYNRSKFRRALYTSFFGVDIKNLNNSEYDKDDNEAFRTIMEWKKLLDESSYIELFDSIINRSNLKYVHADDNISIITKYKQIANYCCDYLTSNHSVEDLIDKLKLLKKNQSSDDDEDNLGLVEKGTDYKGVQIMTMHASKGLDFPVVIFYSPLNPKRTSLPYVVSINESQNKQKYLCLTKEYENDLKNNYFDEESRLFYVAYTRAKSILMIPLFSQDDCKFKSLTTSTNKMLDSEYVELVSCKNIPFTEFKIITNKILKQNKNIDFNLDSKKIQEGKLKEFIKTLSTKGIYQKSYSSLAHPIEDKLLLNVEEEVDLENESIDNTLGYDSKGINLSYNYDNSNIYNDIPLSFPKGTNIGTNLHYLFEKLDYTNPSNINIKELFSRNDYSDENIEYIKKIVHRVLNAKLPSIKGNKLTNEIIYLKDIDFSNRLNEVNFDFKTISNNFFTGSIDLLFRHDDVYSIVDWKSDTLDINDYSNIEVIKNHVDQKYSIQRVLYSYSLIKWLSKSMNKSEIDVFNNHFGGVYYILIKGCVENTSNGIYSHTWNSYEDLKEAYENIIKKFLK